MGGTVFQRSSGRVNVKKKKGHIDRRLVLYALSHNENDDSNRSHGTGIARRFLLLFCFGLGFGACGDWGQAWGVQTVGMLFRDGASIYSSICLGLVQLTISSLVCPLASPGLGSVLIQNFESSKAVPTCEPCCHRAVRCFGMVSGCLLPTLDRSLLTGQGSMRAEKEVSQRRRFPSEGGPAHALMRRPSRLAALMKCP